MKFLNRREAEEIGYRSEIDKINANARVFERAIIMFIESNAPSIVVAEVRVSVVEVV